VKPISLSTDHAIAVLALAKRGSIRGAAEELNISEQGVRNRLLVLENRLGVEVYRKARGIRTHNPLTKEGLMLLPHAAAFLDRARELTDSFAASAQPVEIHIVATQYLMLYVLIDAVRDFHNAFPLVRIRLTNRKEREIEQALLDDPSVAFGVTAPYEPSAKLKFEHLFSMGWSLITPKGHPLSKRRVRLKDLADSPLILFEPGSTGRQHVIDAFHGLGLSPRIETETTNTEVIVRMVEAGLGLSIVPLMASGAVTRGRRVSVCPIADPIAPIHSGILRRRGERLSSASQSFVTALRSLQL
jgi:DNA-binding transcriptional LysR family regulator